VTSRICYDGWVIEITSGFESGVGYSARSDAGSGRSSVFCSSKCCGGCTLEGSALDRLSKPTGKEEEVWMQGCQKEGPSMTAYVELRWMGVLSEVWDEVEFLRVIKQRLGE
jgi:hypothetical protein